MGANFFGLLSDDWLQVGGIKIAMLAKVMLEFIILNCTVNFVIKCGWQLLNYFQCVLVRVRKNRHFAVGSDVQLFHCEIQDKKLIYHILFPHYF